MLDCLVSSLEKTETYKNLKSVTLPTFLGQTQILSNHSEAFILIKKGKIIFNKNNGIKKSIDVSGGECYFKDNKLNIIL